MLCSALLASKQVSECASAPKAWNEDDDGDDDDEKKKKKKKQQQINCWRRLILL